MSNTNPENIDIVITPSPTDPKRQHATIRDSKSQRAWGGEGNTANEAGTEAMRKFLGDRRAREYVG